MGRIGSWYLKRVPAEPNEEVIASYSANFLRQDARPLGGKLYVTTNRVIFTPHLIDALLSGERYEIALGDVLEVKSHRPTGTDRYGAGKKERLLVRTTTDEEAAFIVNKLEAAVERIDTEVAREITGDAA